MSATQPLVRTLGQLAQTLHEAEDTLTRLRRDLDEIDPQTLDAAQHGRVDALMGALEAVVETAAGMAATLEDSTRVLAEYERPAPTDAQLREARDLYGEEGELEIDDDAQLSLGRDSAWVQAWVKLPDAGGTD